MKKCLALLACLLLPACTTWVNPNVEPGKMDTVRNHDEDYCRRVSENMVPIGQGNVLDQPNVSIIDQISNYNMEYDENHRQMSAFERCMRNRGWLKQDTF